MPPFSPSSYGPAFEPLLSTQRTPSIGPGEPDLRAQDDLIGLRPQFAFAHTTITDPQMANACIAGAWLLHDYLDQSHRFSQDIDTPEGSFWHGIMHRREPDYPNAKYWFKRVGNHPIFPQLLNASKRFINPTSPPDANKLANAKSWDPYRFIDTCEKAYNQNNALETFCQQIQLAEFQLLFDHCYAAATA